MASPGSKENLPPSSTDSHSFVDKKLDVPAPKRRRVEAKSASEAGTGFESVLERLRETGGTSASSHCPAVESLSVCRRGFVHCPLLIVRQCQQRTKSGDDPPYLQLRATRMMLSSNRSTLMNIQSQGRVHCSASSASHRSVKHDVPFQWSGISVWVNQEGHSVLAHVHDFLPYFWVAAPRGFSNADCRDFANYLNVGGGPCSSRVIISCVVANSHFFASVCC
jgi:hypothetical protein